jgi:hypothetical protein
MICSVRFRVRSGEYRVPVPGHENRIEDTMPASAYVPVPGHKAKYAGYVQLRYNYRLYPSPGQRAALARAFGCARVVFNDGLRIREQAHQAGLPYVTDRELTARLTAVKATPERAWLADVSAVILQQSEGPQGRAAPVQDPERQAAGGPVHRQCPVQDPRQRAAAPAEDR